MRKFLNRAQLIGHITKDADLKVLPSGESIATFSVATDRSWVDSRGEAHEETDFNRVVAWSKLAELCGKIVTKGSKVFVEGRLQTRKLTNKNNEEFEVTEIVLGDIILLTPKRPDTETSFLAE